MIAALLLAAAAAAPQGKLVVVVVIDQLRYADLLWLSHEIGHKGFAGLGHPASMRYETAVAETAIGHSVISTGTYPDVNGIVGNSFWEGNRIREAVEDPSCPVWGSKVGRSAAALRAPTVGDALKLTTGGASRVVSVGVKDRSALFLAGTSADLALWWEHDLGEMASTTCYAPGPPEWLPRHPAEPFKEWIWTMSRPEAIARLVPEARAAGATPVYDLGPEFPHRVGRGALDQRFHRAIRVSPAGTTIALKTARAAVTAFKLGDSGRTDLLAVALASVDAVGHQYGLLSRERVDALLRVHDELSAFLDELRARLGKRLSIVLTSDHGLTPTEPEERRLRAQGGSIAVEDLIARLETGLDEALGQRQEDWVAGIEGNTVVLRPPLPPKAVEAAVGILRREPGFLRVVSAAEVESAEPFIRRAFFPGRSGQILLVVRPLWTLKPRTVAADHGSYWNDDSLVPLMLESSSFRLRGEGPFRATQVAPTLALLLQIAPPSAAFDSPAVEPR
jgi:hypothetical protein